MADLKSYQAAAIHRRHEHFAFLGGVAVGKTFTGVHFALECMELEPELTGMIGANNHDQLSQVSMREMIYWLDEYGYDYVIDQRPPNQPKKFKTYKNIISVRTKKNPKIWTHAFTRIMSAPNPLRGTEFSWYWLDETRDTPENTHDVIMSRMRESMHFRRGLITSTTNGEDWCYKRFVQCRHGQSLYGSMHVPTIESVRRGIISMDYYQTLRETYSELMAMQELDALHVNVRGGRAYYSFGPWNEKAVAPWGARYPVKTHPLIVGCDFNYAPAPCVWMIGQVGGAEGKQIHWFGEISASETSTEAMTMMLVDRYPGFHYRIFGDSSGNRGTTSNAGRHDYAQMAEVLYAARAQFTIDADQANPRVKYRVENMNRLAKNAVGETHMTYDPIACPHFHSDVKIVGWKPLPFARTERLDNMGDLNRTHASDGAGYAAFKLFPPAYHTFLPGSIPSPLVTETGGHI